MSKSSGSMKRNSASSGSGGIKAAQNTEQEKQKPTNAKLIEHMNEAQIDREIAEQKRVIANAEKAMKKNDMTQTADAIAMREAFPLGVGGSGWTEARKRQKTRQMERDSRLAAAYTDAYKRKETAQTRIEALEKAKKQISGTGKTLNQVREERRKAAESAPKTIQWKSSKQGSTRVYESGGMKITHSQGGFFILRLGGREYMFDKLKTAQAAAERLKR